MATAETTFTNTKDWQCNVGVLERNKYMFKHKLAADVAFIVGSTEKERIEAHKYILISGSPVFWTMFCGDLKENGDVKVPDIKPKVFKEMLRFLYYEEVIINPHNLYDVLYAANKYFIPSLTKQCTDYMESILSIKQVCRLLDYCLMFDLKPLDAKCLKLIRQETSDVIATNGFKTMSYDTLIKITGDDMLSIEEPDLLLACIDWAVQSLLRQSIKVFSGPRLREVLGDALFQIRFTQMNTKDFGNLVVKAGILTKDEEIMCYRYNSQSKKPANFPFPTKPRMGQCTAAVGLVNKALPLYDSSLTSQSTIELEIKNTSGTPFLVVGFKAYVVPEIIMNFVHKEDDQEQIPLYKTKLLRFFRINRCRNNGKQVMYSDNIIESVRHQTEDGTKLVVIKPFVLECEELVSICAMYFYSESRWLAYRSRFAPFACKDVFSSWVSIVNGGENPFTEICVQPVRYKKVAAMAQPMTYIWPNQ